MRVERVTFGLRFHVSGFGVGRVGHCGRGGHASL